LHKESNRSDAPSSASRNYSVTIPRRTRKEATGQDYICIRQTATTSLEPLSYDLSLLAREISPKAVAVCVAISLEDDGQCSVDRFVL
jgi:hypothetical protein